MLLAPTHQRRQSATSSLQHHPLEYGQSSTQLQTSTWYPLYSTPNIPAQTVLDGLNYGLPLEEQTSAFAYGSAPRSSNDLCIQAQRSFGSSQEQDLMPTDPSVIPSSWHFSNGQLTQNSSRAHHRESSLSSIGSVGPSSPYPQHTSHPQVVLPPDSAAEVYYDAGADQTTYHTYLKTPSHTQDFLVNSFQQQYDNLGSYQSNPNFATIMAINKQRNSGDDELMPAPEYAHSARPSVASTHDSPATPSMIEDFEDRKIGETAFDFVEQWMNQYSQFDHTADFRNSNTIPKLDRTMSDACNDELYSPSFSFVSAPPKKVNTTMLSPSNSDIFSQRLQAANSQHLASTQTLLMNQSRGRSPFRHGSPLAPTMNNFGSQSSPQLRMGSAAQIREQQKAENDARALQQQIERSSPQQITPKTISPKDAMIEYHEADEDMAMPLFPPQAGTQYKLQNSRMQEAQSDYDDTASQQSFGSMATSRRESSSAYSTSSQATPQQTSGFNFAPPSVPGSVQVPQQYPFVPQQRRHASNMVGLADRTPDFPSTLASMESTGSEYTPDSADVEKPVGSSADGGTYTCTYHGCTLRFESPAKLQKHKREGHRQSGSAGSAAGSGMTSAASQQSSQAGPHTCRRINPSTGKPCNTLFSRPYDLTRHEDTIHNARKLKVRCHLCTEEKTFSRNDALTRHMRVVHPEVDFPGKIRRRGRD